MYFTLIVFHTDFLFGLFASFSGSFSGSFSSWCLFLYLGTWTDEQKEIRKQQSENGGGSRADDPHEVKLRAELNSNRTENKLQQQLQHVCKTNGGENALEFRKNQYGNCPAINRKISIVFHTFEDNDDWGEQTAYLMHDSTDEEEFSLERARVTYNGIAKLLCKNTSKKSKQFNGERYLFIAGTSDRIRDIMIE